MERKSKLSLPKRLAVLASAVLAGTAADAQPVRDLQPGEIGRVESIVDGDTLFLDSGLKVRLSAMQSPKLSLGRDHVKDWPLGHEAKSELYKLAHNKTVQLYYGGLKRDRYDRALAQVYLLGEDGERTIWLQEEMVRRGFGRVYTWPDTWQDSEKLYAAEQEARAEERGIWALPFYKVRGPEPNALSQDMDSYQIVEGIITKTADVYGRIFLNFGADYKTDFTIVVEKENRKRFRAARMDLLALEGAKVRARGWLALDNGPMIELDHPERLEVLD